jgi:Mn2+/Fe2+ NRAMP family transporter
MAAWGPGLVVMLADTDPGNVVAAAQAGAQWGYRLLPLLLILIPALAMIQELTVRLGIFSGRGHGELIRAHFGLVPAWVAALGLIAATVGSLITEFTGVAGVGELYGVPRGVTLTLMASALMLVVLTGSYRRVERAAMIIGLFELAFILVATMARPDPAAIGRDFLDLPAGDADFGYLAAALIGAVFNPWMVYYQQSATVDKKLGPSELAAARWATVVGATLTQLLTACVLMAAAATIGAKGASAPLHNVGEISEALTPFLGFAVGRLVFSLGILGAATVAAIVCSLALAWGLGEVTGYRRSLQLKPFGAPWFYAVYALCVAGGAALVGLAPNLVGVMIGAQVLNAFLLPVVLGFLLVLAVRSLPAASRLSGWYLWLVAAIATAVCALGLLGGIRGLIGAG